MFSYISNKVNLKSVSLYKTKKKKKKKTGKWEMG